MMKPYKERRLKYYDDHIIIKNYIKAPVAYCISKDKFVLIDPNFNEIELADVDDPDLRTLIYNYIQTQLETEFPLLDKNLLLDFKKRYNS